MSSIKDLKEEADRSHEKFNETMSDIRGRLRSPALADNMLKSLSPDFIHLRRLQSAMREQPLLAALTIAGACWLISRAVVSPAGRSGRTNERLPRKSEIEAKADNPPTVEQETTNGHDQRYD
jgi:hypothetical protein